MSLSFYSSFDSKEIKFKDSGLLYSRGCLSLREDTFTNKNIFNFLSVPDPHLPNQFPNGFDRDFGNNDNNNCFPVGMYIVLIRFVPASSKPFCLCISM